jgi:hypothetical protein
MIAAVIFFAFIGATFNVAKGPRNDAINRPIFFAFYMNFTTTIK